MLSDTLLLSRPPAPAASIGPAVSPVHGLMLEALASRRRVTAPRRWHAVLSPLMLDADRIETDVAAIVRLARLIAMLPALAFDGDDAAYFAFLGLPESLWPTLRDGAMPAGFFARPDCVLSGGRLQVLEFNIGTGTVNLSAAFASKLHLGLGGDYPAIARELAQDWELAEWSADLALTEVIRDLGQGAAAALWYHDSSEQGRRRVADMCELLVELGAPAVPVHTSEIGANRRPVYGYHSTVHLLGSEGPQLAAAVGGLGDSDRRYVRPGDLARTAKTNLALLHELADGGRLSEQDTLLVRRYIPETRTVQGLPREVRENKDSWILKPGISFKARGVLLGRDLSASDWSAALDASPNAVVQRVVGSDPIPLPVQRGDSVELVDHGTLVLMPHIIDGRSTGLSARYSLSETVLGRVDFESVHSTYCVLARSRETGRSSDGSAQVDSEHANSRGENS